MEQRPSIVDTTEKIVLTYGIIESKLEKIKEVSNQYNYRIINILDNQTFCNVEDLIFENTQDCIVNDAEPIEIEFLLFVNIRDDALYDFIADLKKIGMYFPNKAILTPTNLKWKLRRLLAENKEEHTIMNMFTNLRRAMKKANIIKNENKHDQELIEIMEKAEHYLNPREFDFDEMKEIHNKLAIKVNNLGAMNNE